MGTIYKVTYKVISQIDGGALTERFGHTFTEKPELIIKKWQREGSGTMPDKRVVTRVYEELERECSLHLNLARYEGSDEWYEL